MSKIEDVQRALGKELGTGMAPRALAVAAIEAMAEQTPALRPTPPILRELKEGDTISMHADGVLYRGTVGKDGIALLRPDHI